MGNPSTLYANTDQLEKLSQLLSGFPQDAVRIVNRVLPRAAATVRVEAGRQIPKVYGVAQKEIRSALASKQRKVIAGIDREGSISVSVVGRPLTVTRFQHSPTTPPGKGKKRPARAMIVRSAGSKLLQPMRGSDGRTKSVFLMPSKRIDGGTPLLFARRTGNYSNKGHERLKILRTLSVPQMVLNEQVGSALVERVNETLYKRISHELDLAFGDLGTNLNGGVR